MDRKRVATSLALLCVICVASCGASGIGLEHKLRGVGGGGVTGIQGDGDDAVTKVLFLPLDERFTTRDAFINLAKVTPYQVITPPTTILPHHKTPADLVALDSWMEANIGAADVAVISMEMFLYGGLIASRCSNQTTEEVMTRLNVLTSYHNKFPNIRWYMSSVVMRIPSYNEDVEEPWYWAYYGADLYTYSYYLDKYDVTKLPSALAKSNAAKAKVPADIVAKFLWRRQRNFNVTSAMVNAYASDRTLYRYSYITLDDNALYGLNIMESGKLKALVKELGLQTNVLIYPGADEVGLTLLARMATDIEGKTVSLRTVFRDPATINLVPNFEGQPMYETLLDQIKAAGGAAVNSSSSDPHDATLLINNFSHFPQYEAADQPMANRSVADYAMFTADACRDDESTGDRWVGFVDNRYSNGADIFFIKYMNTLASPSCMSMARFAYAGWNTDGNTLGTVISNTILLALFGDASGSGTATTGNTYFNTLRIVEDLHYQSELRQRLIAYVDQTSDSINSLGVDLPFYMRYAYKVLSLNTAQVSGVWNLPWQLTEAYYPWNRTFEIGLVASSTGSSSRVRL